MTRQAAIQGKRWYVIHTYSGYEENVAHNLRQRIESMGMEDKIFDVLIPTETKIKIKNGKRRLIREKLYPGYVLVQMMVTDDSWYVVRNTPNVTGFIGTGTIPTPIDEAEVSVIQKNMGVEEPTYRIDIEVGAPVQITDGSFKGVEGKVSEVDESRGRVKVLVNMFGRETPVELDFLQVKKI